MEQAQQVYSQALQAALESGDPRMEMRCRQLLTSFYLQRTHLKDEGAQTASRFLQLAEACRDTAALALAHMYMGRLYFAAIHEDTLYNRPEEGVEHFRQATRLAALAKDQYLEMQSKYELAVLYMTLQQPFKALPLLKETKDYLSSQTPDSKQPILISLIQTYLQLDRPDSAQVYIDEAMTLPDRNNLRYHIYDLLFQYHRASSNMHAPSGLPTPCATTSPSPCGNNCPGKWPKSKRSTTTSNWPTSATASAWNATAASSSAFPSPSPCWGLSFCSPRPTVAACAASASN